LHEATLSDGWLKSHDLASTIDLYVANRWSDGDKPRAGALGLTASTKFSGTSNARNFNNVTHKAQSSAAIGL